MDALSTTTFDKPSNLEGMAEFAYVSQTNSIDSQVKGYEDKTKTKLCDTQTVNPPTEGGTEGATQGGLNTPSLQVEVEEKEKGKEKGKEDINTRKQDFYKSLIPFLDTYSKDLLKDFFEYWTEHDVNDKKFRREKEKRKYRQTGTFHNIYYGRRFGKWFNHEIAPSGYTSGI